MIDWPPKAPTAEIDYRFDWSDGLQEGEVIASFTIDAVGVTVDDSEIDGEGIRVWLSGGVEGTVARVTATVTTNSTPPRTDPETAILPIGGGPVSLATAKAHLRVDFDTDDALIRAYLRASAGSVEQLTGRALSPRVIEQRMNSFPIERSGRILLGRDPVQEVVAFTYLDSDGVEQSLVEEDGDFRTVAGEPYLLFPDAGASWPSSYDEEGAVRVRYLAGYEAGQAPPELIAAVLMMTGHLYANREAVGAAVGEEVPLGVKALCFPHRRNLLG